MAILLDIFSWISLLTGAGLMIVGAVGLIRLPDLYTRMHAAGIIDTLAMGLIVLGMMFQAANPLNFIKLVLILLFIMLTSPTATHAVAKAALHGGLKPRVAPEVFDEETDGDSGKDFDKGAEDGSSKT